MAIVGNAKNARVVISGVVTNDVLVTEITIRGNRYRFHANNGSGYMNTAEITKLPSTVLGSKKTWSGLSTIEAVDSRLRMWKGAGTWENTPANVRIEVFDSTHLMSGAWELTQGTLVSFENLDAPSTIAVTGVTLNKATTSLAPLTTEQLTATVAPADATNKDVTWSSSTPAVATVSATGLVTGVAGGTATITVTTADGAKTATCVVTVVSTPKIYIGTQAVSKMYIGDQEVLHAYLGEAMVF